jgi:YidC/Oxa1 family membrane protein insertase
MFVFAPFDAVVGVAHTAVDGLADLLTPFTGDLAAAAAIVLLTIGVRLLVSPLSYLQVRGERRRAALAPRLAELQQWHRGDPQRLAAETLALHRAAGAGLLAGCLPALLQAPFFMVMYRLVTVPPTGAPDVLSAGRLFGVPLTAHLPAGPTVFAVLLALAAVLAWWSSRRIRRAQSATASPADAAPAAGARGAAPSTGRDKDAGNPTAGSSGVADGPAAVVGRLLTLLPYAMVLVVAVVPLAGGLYVVTSAAWTAAEHAVWRRPRSQLRD